MARWYIIHAYSGFENKVRESILHEAERKGLSQLVEAGRSPRRTDHRGQARQEGPGRTQDHARLCAGQADVLNDDVYHLVKNTAKVTGFLGPNGKPQAISEADAARYFGAREQAASVVKKHVTVDYEIGDAVRVLDGPFASFNGIVEELDFDKSRVKVSVSIFGRATPVELDFEHVERQK